MQLQSKRLVRLALNAETFGDGVASVAKPGNGSTITVWSDADLPDWIARVDLTFKSSHDSAASGVICEVTFDKGASWVAHPNLTAGASYVAATDLTAAYSAPRVGDGMRWRYANSAAALTVWTGEVRAWNDRAKAT